MVIFHSYVSLPEGTIHGATLKQPKGGCHRPRVDSKPSNWGSRQQIEQIKGGYCFEVNQGLT